MFWACDHGYYSLLGLLSEARGDTECPAIDYGLCLSKCTLYQQMINILKKVHL